jgi:hypothetical protein
MFSYWKIVFQCHILNQRYLIYANLHFRKLNVIENINIALTAQNYEILAHVNYR